MRKRWQLFLFQAVQSYAPRAARGLSQDHVTMQALWMVLAAFLFASMGVCVKMASAHFNAAELVFYRGLIGIAIHFIVTKVQRAVGYIGFSEQVG